ncbi:tumor necrosis factor receptor superfamily member 27 isoform X3 [Paroedura picta]|uniref:tumor necrosis factor receptor superfamily member 27 isoform X3 n=1 Tax=Paroedura picta TaxID=143630 RepID=UPI004056701C
MRGAALLFALMLATEAAHPLANPVECQASEYLDDRGKCAPCRECGPGLELSKECGYGEGGDSQCVLCRPRRFKENWGHHGCKPCLSCTLINRIQKSQCTASLNAVCGACFPGFYSKTQIGGLQDLECVPCTEQTPPSEPQCRPRVTLEKAGNPAGLTLDKALVVFTSSALLIILLVSLLSLLYCQRFWKSQCQRGKGLLWPEGDVSGFCGASRILPPRATPKSLLLDCQERKPLSRILGRTSCGAEGMRRRGMPAALRRWQQRPGSLRGPITAPVHPSEVLPLKVGSRGARMLGALGQRPGIEGWSTAGTQLLLGLRTQSGGGCPVACDLTRGALPWPSLPLSAALCP